MTSAKQMERALAEALSALSFYADAGTYFAIGFMPDRPCGGFMDDFSMTELGRKPGKRARVALGKVQRLMRGTSERRQP